MSDDNLLPFSFPAVQRKKITAAFDVTEERLVLADLLEKGGDGDFLRAVAEAVLQLLMEADVEGLIGAGRYERSGERSTQRHPDAAVIVPPRSSAVPSATAETAHPDDAGCSARRCA